MGIARASLFTAVIGCFLVLGCTRGTTVGTGNVNGRPWEIVAYPEDQAICFNLGPEPACSNLSEGRRVDFEVEPVSNQSTRHLGGLARPEVATVRMSVNGESVDLPTVPLSFRPDLRGFGLAFANEDTTSPIVIAILDAQGNELSQTLAP